MRTASGQRSRTVFKNSTPVTPGMRWSQRTTWTASSARMVSASRAEVAFMYPEIVFEDALKRLDAPHLVVDHQN